MMQSTLVIEESGVNAKAATNKELVDRMGRVALVRRMNLAAKR